MDHEGPKVPERDDEALLKEKIHQAPKRTGQSSPAGGQPRAGVAVGSVQPRAG